MTYIKRLEITAFGKFNNHVIDFDKGYNEIILPNESGKSTITDFMLFMLYGFVKTTKKTVTLEDNLLQKYLPWSDIGYIAGAMVISKDGEEFRIERRHQKSRQSSEAVIRDETGREIPIVKQPGEYFFGLDKDTFARTFFIRQTDIKFKSTDGIVTALKNLVTTGDEDMSFETATSILEDQKKKYHHIGRRSGRIYDIQKEIVQTESDIYNLERSFESIEHNKTELDTLKAEIDKLCHKETELKNSRKAALAKDAKEKLEKLADIELEYNKLKSSYDNNSASNLTDSDFADIASVYSKRDALTNRKRELTEEKNQLETKLGLLLQQIPDYEYIKQNESDITLKINDKGTPNSVLIILGVLTFIGGIVTAFALSPILFGVSAIGIVLAVLGAILKRKPRIDSVIAAQLELFRQNGSEIELTKALIRNNETRVSEFEKEFEITCKKCDDIRLKLGVDNQEQLASLLASRNNTAIIQSRMAELERKKADILDGQTVEKLKQTADTEGECQYGVSELESLITRISQQKAELLSRAASITTEAEKANVIQREIYIKRETISELKEELETAKYRTLVLDTALEAMQNAYDKINKMFSPKLTEKAKKPLSLITNGKYSEVYLDRDFVIRIKADGELKELGYFSRGTADAVYFAVRRAVAELISDTDNVPIIMDDPFWSFDDERLQSAIEYIKLLATDSQIILFAARK